jgi:hypothetical protein
MVQPELDFWLKVKFQSTQGPKRNIRLIMLHGYPNRLIFKLLASTVDLDVVSHSMDLSNQFILKWPTKTSLLHHK